MYSGEALVYFVLSVQHGLSVFFGIEMILSKQGKCYRGSPIVTWPYSCVVKRIYTLTSPLKENEYLTEIRIQCLLYSLYCTQG